MSSEFNIIYQPTKEDEIYVFEEFKFYYTKVPRNDIHSVVRFYERLFAFHFPNWVEDFSKDLLDPESPLFQYASHPDKSILFKKYCGNRSSSLAVEIFSNQRKLDEYFKAEESKYLKKQLQKKIEKL